MSNIVNSLLRLPFAISSSQILRTVPLQEAKRIQFARGLWHMSTQSPSQPANLYNSHQNCTCCRNFHTKGPLHQDAAASQAGSITQGEKELGEFLVEEIATEKKMSKNKQVPNEIHGFKAKYEGSEVTLVKTNKNEEIEVGFNVNHSVDMEGDPDSEKSDFAEMKSKPSFEVEIRRNGQVLGFACSMASPQEETQDQQYNDLFAIDEVYFYEGEWNETGYSVSGDVLDGTMYDLFMNLLEDKGVTNEFVKDLIELSTAYEHSQYVSLLEKVRKFVSPQ